MSTIELLAPARNIDCGIEAIRHGADAVYIGGPEFGARAAAGNSIDDITRLCDYAHLFGARIYVTLNTILYDAELAEAEKLVWKLWQAGVDALIVQDMALLKLHLPPIALHASTQMDNCTADKARWLEAAGFRQLVLARELSLEQIRVISSSVSVPIEVFVHGALCVSYSGRCYASEYCFRRSANRGTCAQFCRLSFDLVDGRGKTIVRDRHLLSLRDMNRTASLEEMMDAGVRSFKIEGRLKDPSYVKNVTAWYRQHIDEVLSRRSADYRRSSYGLSAITFTPDVNRSFNRGFTDYFLHGRSKAPISNPASPKAIGSVIGRVSKVEERSFLFCPINPQTTMPVAGDGLCFIGEDGRLQGFRVNKVEGNRVYPAAMPRIRQNTPIHRSLDHAMDRVLSRSTATRTLETEMTFRETSFGFAIDICDETGNYASTSFDYPHEPARTSQEEAIKRQLTKTGQTPFRVSRIDITFSQSYFIPASVLTEWRRAACDALMRAHRASYTRDRSVKPDEAILRTLSPDKISYSANVSNHLGKRFYLDLGVHEVEDALECDTPRGAVTLMTCRHCIRHDLGICLKHDHSVPEPLSLRLPDGRTFPLKFDCRRCEMQVLSPNVHPQSTH